MPTTTDEARQAFILATEAVRDASPDLSTRQAFGIAQQHSTAFSTYASFAAYQRRDGRQLAPPPTDEATDDADHIRREIEELFDELATHSGTPYTVPGTYGVKSPATIGRQARKARQTIGAVPSLHRHRKRRNPPESTTPPTDPIP